jgi:CarD family transcriptional regulator
MDFQIGDKVIHATHGLGEVVEIEEKVIQEHKKSCYVVRTQNLTIWVPVDNTEHHSLRVPTSTSEFTDLFTIFHSPPQPLPEDRLERKKLLHDLLNDGQISSICRVVRDLTFMDRQKKLNEEDRSILERAKKSLLDEWVYSLDVPLAQARQQMSELLGG